MDPRFQAFPTAQEIATALGRWPELAGMRIRPFFVSAFGDIYVEVQGGAVYVADPLELTCEQATDSVAELENLFADAEWAQERLMSDVILLAEAKGVRRARHEVFGVAPHPVLGGPIQADHLVALTLSVWHDLAAQFRSELLGVRTRPAVD